MFSIKLFLYIISGVLVQISILFVCIYIFIHANKYNIYRVLKFYITLFLILIILTLCITYLLNDFIIKYKVFLCYPNIFNLVLLKSFINTYKIPNDMLEFIFINILIIYVLTSILIICLYFLYKNKVITKRYYNIIIIIIFLLINILIVFYSINIINNNLIDFKCIPLTK